MSQRGEQPPEQGPMEMEENSRSWTEMNLLQKMNHVLVNISVEPVALMYVMPSLLSRIATENLFLEKACRVSLNFTEELCDSLSERDVTNETEAFQAEVPQTVAEMRVWQAPVQNIFPIILILFMGSWSDRRRRRKPLILIPIIGSLLMTAGLLLCSIFLRQWSLEVTAVIEGVLPALTANMFFLAIFSFVGDITTASTRTFRIGMLTAVLCWGNPFATALSGVSFTALGFTGVYAVGIVVYVCALAYGLRLQEPRPSIPRPKEVSFVADFCNWRHAWDTIQMGVKRREGSRRLQLLLVVLLYVTVQGPLRGEDVVSFLYVTTRYRWDNIAVSAFTTYIIVLNAVGSFLVTTILSGWLKLDDCIIGMLCMAARALSCPAAAYSTEGWQFYAATAPDGILIVGSDITMRAIATKLVDSDELGKLLALLAVIEAIIPLVFNPVYSEVYRNTALTHPGAMFYISGIFYTVGSLIFWTIYLMQRRTRVEAALKDGPGGVANATFTGNDGDRLSHNTHL